MDYLDIFWLVLMILMLVFELATVGLTTIWVAGGALAALIVALFNGPLWRQIVLFLAVTVVLLWFTRPLAVKYLNSKKMATNYEATKGKEVLVLERVDNMAETGKVRLDGMEWTARSIDNDITFEENEKAYVKDVSGVKLMIVKERPE